MSNWLVGLFFLFAVYILYINIIEWAVLLNPCAKDEYENTYIILVYGVIIMCTGLPLWPCTIPFSVILYFVTNERERNIKYIHRFNLFINGIWVIIACCFLYDR